MKCTRTVVFQNTHSDIIYIYIILLYTCIYGYGAAASALGVIKVIARLTRIYYIFLHYTFVLHYMCIYNIPTLATERARMIDTYE